MKRAGWLFTCILLFFVFSCKKQIQGNENYSSFGRAYAISGNQNITGAIKSPDGGYLLWGDADAGSHGKQDGFLMKLDKDYKQLWYKTYGGFADEYFSSATFDEQGNILVGGNSTSFGVSIDSNSTIANPSIYAVFVNTNGELLWQKTYTGNPVGLNYKNFLTKVLLLPNKSFVLIGSSSNYLQKFGSNYYYIPNAFIQCINRQGDTLWQGHYNFFDTILPLPDYPLSYTAGNAILNPDGNIEMLVFRLGANDKTYFPLSLFKVSPNSGGGNNNYITRIPIQGYSHGVFLNLDFDKQFFPMQLLSESPVTYLIADQGKMVICNEQGIMLKQSNLNTTSPILDMACSNGFAIFATNDQIIKTDLNGTIIWISSDYKKLKIDKVNGIFIEDDNNISAFCSYTNALGEKDISLLRINSNGQLIVK